MDALVCYIILVSICIACYWLTKFNFATVLQYYLLKHTGLMRCVIKVNKNHLFV